MDRFERSSLLFFLIAAIGMVASFTLPFIDGGTGWWVSLLVAGAVAIFASPFVGDIDEEETAEGGVREESFEATASPDEKMLAE